MRQLQIISVLWLCVVPFAAHATGTLLFTNDQYTVMVHVSLHMERVADLTILQGTNSVYAGDSSKFRVDNYSHKGHQLEVHSLGDSKAVQFRLLARGNVAELFLDQIKIRLSIDDWEI